MTQAWLKALILLDPNVDNLVYDTKDENADNYQLKIEVWKSISRRALVGRLTYLPDKSSCSVFIKLPVL